MPNRTTAAPAPTQAYTILVKVYAPTQADAFSHVEQAIEEYIDRRGDAGGLNVHVGTQDGTRATQF